jgi:hypothetical protein
VGQPLARITTEQQGGAAVSEVLMSRRRCRSAPDRGSSSRLRVTWMWPGRSLAVRRGSARSATVAVSPGSHLDTDQSHGYPMAGLPTPSGTGMGSGRRGARRAAGNVPWLPDKITVDAAVRSDFLSRHDRRFSWPSSNFGTSNAPRQPTEGLSTELFPHLSRRG